MYKSKISNISNIKVLISVETYQSAKFSLLVCKEIKPLYSTELATTDRSFWKVPNKMFSIGQIRYSYHVPIYFMNQVFYRRKIKDLRVAGEKFSNSMYNGAYKILQPYSNVIIVNR